MGQQGRLELNDPDKEKQEIINKYKLLGGAIDKMRYQDGHWMVGNERAENYFAALEEVQDVRDSDMYHGKHAA